MGLWSAADTGISFPPRRLGISDVVREYGEDTVRALADGVEGISEWTRPPVPESGFTDDQPAQSKAVPKLTRAG